MWYSLKEAKNLWINIDKLKFKDRISETYWLNDNSIKNNKKNQQNWQEKSNKDLTKYWTKRKIFHKGLYFKSNLEIKRFDFLEMCKNIWIIKNFEYEPEKFVLQESFKFKNETYYIITYTPDFKVYLNNWNIVYEDTKSSATSKNSTYKVKSKLFVYKYIFWKENLDFKEIFEWEDRYF